MKGFLHKWCCVRLFFCADWCCPNGPCRKRKLDRNNYLFKQGLQKLYSEIDLLEVIKQLRILRYLNTITLTAHQRELIKFQNDYTLMLRKKKYGGQGGKDGEASHPADEALLDFKPETNENDAKLYEEIVEKTRKNRFSSGEKRRKDRRVERDSSNLSNTTRSDNMAIIFGRNRTQS